MHFMDTKLEVEALRQFDDSYRKELYRILSLVGKPLTEKEIQNIAKTMQGKKDFLLHEVGLWWVKEGAGLYKLIMSRNIIDDDQILVEKLQEHLRLFLQVITQTVEDHINAFILDDETLEKLENPWTLK